MGYVPTARELALYWMLAVPPLSVGWPICVVPLKKVTVPVGVPLPEVGVTVALIVMGLVEPTPILVGETVSAVVVAAGFTVRTFTPSEPWLGL